MSSNNLWKHTEDPLHSSNYNSEISYSVIEFPSLIIFNLLGKESVLKLQLKNTGKQHLKQVIIVQLQRSDIQNLIIMPYFVTILYPRN